LPGVVVCWVLMIPIPIEVDEVSEEKKGGG